MFTYVYICLHMVTTENITFSEYEYFNANDDEQRTTLRLPPVWKTV